MGRWLRAVLRGGAQGAPIAGVLGAGWSPAGGLLLYWFESVMVLGATALLLALWGRRHGTPEEIERAGIRPSDVLLVHGGAFGIFGAFLAGFLLILITNGRLEVAPLGRSFAGLPWIALFVGVELAADLWRLDSTRADDLSRRVDAGSRRLALFWLVGFVGLLLAMLTGRPLALFALFAGLKAVFELGSALAAPSRFSRQTRERDSSGSRI
jgi:hypothetical protein